MREYLRRMKATGCCPRKKPLGKVAMWSCAGAFLGIYAILLCGQYLHLSATQSLFLIGSFGASATLVYGAPAAEFSQPRNLVGGHFISALIGVAAFQLIGEGSILAQPIAVSLAIVAMQLTHTLHPPGGATALIAVTGGAEIHSLGYKYVICPVLIGSLILLLVGLLVNNLSRNPKRHYPVYWL